MSKISELSDGGVIQGGDTLIAVRSGGNVKVTYGGTTTANIDGGTIDGTTIGGTTPAAGSFTTGSFTGDVSFGDNDKAIFGAGSDLQIYHDGTHSKIEDAGSGDLKFITDGSGFNFQKGSSETLANFAIDGAVTLYYNNSAKLATTATGIDVTGNAAFGDNGKAIFGAGSDLQIYHDGSASYIKENGTGDLIIQGSNTMRFQGSSNQELANFTTSGAVTLFNNGSAKLATTSTGIDVTGSVTADGLNVDAGSTSLIGTLQTTANNSSLVYSDASQTLILKNDDASGTARLKFLGTASESGAITFGGGVGATSDTFVVYPRVMAGGKAFNITGGGNISFYEDTGTTAKFQWSASNENLSITGQKDSASLTLSAPLNTVGGGNLADYNEVLFDNSHVAGTSGQAYLRHYANSHNDQESALAFGVTAATGGTNEAVRIDGSGNLLVGRTLAGSGTGFEANTAFGSYILSTSTSIAGVFDRLSTDGEIVQFRKDSTAVGSIGTAQSSMYIGGTSSGAIYFNGTTDIRPWNTSTQANLDDTMDLGSSSARFKDLHMSGTGSFGTNVGIGTSGVGAKLHVLSGTDNNIAANVSEVRFIGADKAITAEQANLVIQTNDDMAVNKGGSIGLGGRHTTSSTNGGNFAQISGRKENATSANFAGYLAFGTSDSASDIHERMRIDSSGQVRLSNTTPVWDLTFSSLVTKGGFTGSQSTNYLYSGQNLYFNNGFKYSASSNATLYEQSFGNHIFYNAPSGTAGNAVSLTQAMTLDTSGNLLVGTTSESTWQSAAGFRARNSGSTTITRDGNPPLYVNRLSSDGTLLQFQKGTSVIGSIGCNGAAIHLASGTTGIRVISDNTIRPSDASGALKDNAIDLGASNARWKDLYLSGDVIAPNIVASNGVFLGGTSNANKLDDYEEGTWNVGFTGATVTAAITVGRYTKIGRVVYFSYYSGSSTIASASGQAHITGLPFVVENNAEAYQPFYTSHNTFFGGSTSVGVEGYANAGNTNLIFTNRGTTVSSNFVNGSAKFIMVAGFYLTTA